MQCLQNVDWHVPRHFEPVPIPISIPTGRGRIWGWGRTSVPWRAPPHNIRKYLENHAYFSQVLSFRFWIKRARFVWYMPNKINEAGVSDFSLIEIFSILLIDFCRLYSTILCHDWALAAVKIYSIPSYLSIWNIFKSNWQPSIIFSFSSKRKRPYNISLALFLSLSHSVSLTRSIIEYLPCSYSLPVCEPVRPIEYSMVGQISCKYDTHVFNRANLIQNNNSNNKKHRRYWQCYSLFFRTQQQ